MPVGLNHAPEWLARVLHGTREASTKRVPVFAELDMASITHNEVRRHPRYREEPSTAVAAPKVYRLTGARLLGLVAVFIVVTALAVLMLKGWLLSLRD